MRHGRFIKAIVIAAAWLVAIPGVASAQSITGMVAVNDLLDRIEKAYATRDIALVTAQLSNQMVAVTEDPNGSGAIVMDKAAFISAVERSFQTKGNATDHKFTKRDIQFLHNNMFALVHTVVVDRMPGGETKSLREAWIADCENGQWRLMMAFPDIGEPAVQIRSILPDGQSAKLGVKRGDTVWSYAQQRILSTQQLIALIQNAKPLGDSTSIPLVVLRGGKETTFALQPGPLGVVLADCVLARDETYYPPEQNHAAKDTFRQLEEARCKGDGRLYVAGCASSSLYLGGRQGAIGPDIRAQEMKALWKQGLKDANLTSCECFDVCAMVRGHCALVSGFVIYHTEKGGFLVNLRFQEYVQQGDVWKLVVDMGTGSRVGPVTKQPEAVAKLIAGEWEWSSGAKVTISADGESWAWRVLDEKARRFLLQPDSMGSWADVVVSEDGKSLMGKDWKGAAVWGKRVSK